jgi:hypothetical protein
MLQVKIALTNPHFRQYDGIFSILPETTDDDLAIPNPSPIMLDRSTVAGGGVGDGEAEDASEIISSSPLLLSLDEESLLRPLTAESLLRVVRVDPVEADIEDDNGVSGWNVIDPATTGCPRKDSLLPVLPCLLIAVCTVARDCCAADPGLLEELVPFF